MRPTAGRRGRSLLGRGRRQSFFWVSGIDRTNGKGAVAGPFNNQTEAASDTGDLTQKRFFTLGTRNMARAKQMIKMIKLRKSGSAHESLRAMKGFKSGRRLRENDDSAVPRRTNADDESVL